MKVRITLDNGDFIEQSFVNADEFATEIAHWSWCITRMGVKDAFNHLKTKATNYAVSGLEQKVPAERV